MSDVYGPIVLPEDAEEAITALLKQWMDTYLRKMEALTGRDSGQLPSVRAWGLGDIEARLDEQEPPAVMVECAKGRKHASGDFYATAWETTISTVTKSTKTYKRSRQLAQIYSTAAALILTHQSTGMGEFLWEDEDYGVLTSATRRFLARGEIKGTFVVPQTSQIEAGPTEPAPDPNSPPGSLPTVKDINVDLTEE